MTMPTGIRERNGRFQMILSRGGRQITGTFDTLDEAKEARVTALHQFSKSTTNTTRQTITIKEAVERAYNVRWEGTKSERTAMINANLLVRYFGPNTQLTAIDTIVVNKFVDSLKEQGLSNSTVNRKLSCLSVILQTAEDHGFATGKPVLTKRKEYKGRERFLTQEEEHNVVSVFEHWSKPGYKDAFITLLDTGMRTGELFKLQKQDADLKQGKHGILIIWRTKNDHPRSIPMTKRVSELIQARLIGLNATDNIFDYNQYWLRNGWDRMKTTLGLQNDKQFVPHILRHTCASRLIQRGVPLMMVQKWMGHESIQSTMRYSHLAPSTLFNLVADE